MLAAVETLASERGIMTVALNVFGSNLSAQQLNRSLGYTVFSMTMHKELDLTLLHGWVGT